MCVARYAHGYGLGQSPVGTAKVRGRGADVNVYDYLGVVAHKLGEAELATSYVVYIYDVAVVGRYINTLPATFDGTTTLDKIAHRQTIAERLIAAIYLEWLPTGNIFNVYVEHLLAVYVLHTVDLDLGYVLKLRHEDI